MAVSPKLYVNKPKKAQLKQHQQQQVSSPLPPAPPPSSSSSSMASSASARSAAPPPQPPRESFVRRYKYLWPMLLAVNFSIGAYLFMRTKKKDVGTDEGEIPDVPSAAVSTAAATAVSEKEKEVTKEVATSPSALPVVVREPIPENQQRELFKWMLEEKRRIKPKDHEEKRRIDEEKAILKHFIRAKSIPVL
ncbi:PREDICTED: probable serine/threonine-protein kinase DDB_G0278665 [Nicotiana attenuata]|uniref:Uncharacterized protein n=1 Tax=Nicotiana attenuata TaxID=49451 RepID=A0A1J6JGE1_NICAT|nr:PREDICTED: probable serine/threonine-protein kinase DDB_G0278665 [Nicotiana attenuata]OIT08735.1 hypothetical protein A4A49_35957 [Nicotiana attenuata]